MKLVLLPGLDGTGQLFRPLLEELSFNIQTQIITYPHDVKLGYKQLLEYVIERLPTEDFILLGESFSGPIAHQVALRKPRYLKLVLFVTSFLENPRPLMLSGELSWPRLLFIRLSLSLPLPGFLIKYFLLGKKADESLIFLFRKVLRIVPPRVISFRLEQISKLDFEVETLDIEAVYLQANNDKLVPHESVKPFKEVFNNLEIKTLEGPHFLLQANPIACAEIIRSVVLQSKQ